MGNTILSQHYTFLDFAWFEDAQTSCGLLGKNVDFQRWQLQRIQNRQSWSSVQPLAPVVRQTKIKKKYLIINDPTKSGVFSNQYFSNYI